MHADAVFGKARRGLFLITRFRFRLRSSRRFAEGGVWVRDGRRPLSDDSVRDG